MTRPYHYNPNNIGRRETSDGINDTTIYISPGNSDDKLSQRDWSDYIGQLAAVVDAYATENYGWWFSPTDAPWQNGVCAFRIERDAVPKIRTALTEVRQEYGQDSVAWAEVNGTEFL